MKGVIIKSTGSWFTVLAGNKQTYACKLKGKFRIKGIKTTNPVAVGDDVIFDLMENENTGLIREILPRHNYIIRKATKLSKVGHIIAANVDQAGIIVTLALPRTSTGFIDRILVTTEAYHIPAFLVFNKIDLYDDILKKEMERLITIYSDAGYPCLRTSAITGENVDLFQQKISGQRSLITGHSGVGKSALLNRVDASLDLKTGDLSGYHKVGMHTTTFAQMYPLSFGGFIIDTPGIKEFGLTDFNRKEIGERFPEMRSRMHGCHFSNCTHVHEPGCKVHEAVENGEVSLSRYESYLSILNDDYWEKSEKDYR